MSRAPLLLNLLPCRPCGVERRFRLAKGKFACEQCGALLTDATTASAVPPLAAQRTALVAGLRLVPCACAEPTTHTGPCRPSPFPPASAQTPDPITGPESTLADLPPRPAPEHADESAPVVGRPAGAAPRSSAHVYGDPW